MKVFVTGSTGFIGTAVVEELLRAGHTVLGMTRSDAGEEQLKNQGAEILRGDLEDVEFLKKGASLCDAVIHLAFVHDFGNFVHSCEVDRAAIEALGSALADAGGNRVLVVTSGIPLPTGDEVVGEDTEATAASFGSPRAASEAICLNFADCGVRTSIVRLPSFTHGPGSSGFGSMLVRTAQKQGRVAYVSEGKFRVNACHRADAAVLYRLALEKAPTRSVFHSLAERVSMKELTTTIGKQMDLPVISISPEEAADYYGWLATFFTRDPRASCEKATAMGWKPTHPTLVDDVPLFVDYVLKK